MTPHIAIVDYGLGNLFSIQQACVVAGGGPSVTADPAEILAADALVLPGMGAFGDAMAALEARDLIGVIKDFSASGRPLLGVCLGLQLLMTEGFEFGRHRGLGLIEGDVVRFENLQPEGDRALKIPQIGWNRIHEARPGTWADTMLKDVPEGAFMYFVHSFHVRPTDRSVWLARATYGGLEFCAALSHGNLIATQFHPERSGPDGLSIYRNLVVRLVQAAGSKESDRVSA